MDRVLRCLSIAIAALPLWCASARGAEPAFHAPADGMIPVAFVLTDMANVIDFVKNWRYMDGSIPVALPNRD